jgi:L-phenylalanine/L-methionine N-acetyltransferase
VKVSQIQIRPISTEDVEGFHACLDAVSRERKYLGFLEAPTLENTRGWLEAGIKQSEIRLVASSSSQIVGWCDIETPTREGFRHVGKLGMGVLKNFRGQGLGQALLEKTLATANEQKLERVELEVYASNLVAIHLYETYGFQLEGRKQKARKLDGAYDDIIVMALLFDSSTTETL